MGKAKAPNGSPDVLRFASEKILWPLCGLSVPNDQREVWSLNSDAKDSYYEGQAKVSSHKRLTYLWEATVLKVVKVLVHP